MFFIASCLLFSSTASIFFFSKTVAVRAIEQENHSYVENLVVSLFLLVINIHQVAQKLEKADSSWRHPFKTTPLEIKKNFLFGLNVLATLAVSEDNIKPKLIFKDPVYGKDSVCKHIFIYSMFLRGSWDFT